MKKTLTIIIFATSVFISLNLVADGTNQPYVIQRGNEIYEVRNLPAFTMSELIVDSFVYIDGEYIDPPYIVSVSNLNVCVNGRVMRDFVPLVWIPPFVPKTLPVLSQEITRETDWYDERVLKHIRDTYTYLTQVENLLTEQTLDEMFRVYQALPIVKEVKRDAKNPARFEITYQDGRIINTNIIPLTGRRPPYNLDNVGIHIDQFYESYVNRLSQGIVLMNVRGFEVKSTVLSGGDGGTLALVVKARKAMQGDEQAKQSLLGEMGLTNYQTILHPDWIERLANNTNLETRATQIIETKRERERLERERREQQNH